MIDWAKILLRVCHQFHQHLSAHYLYKKMAPKIQSQKVSRKKLPKRLLYKKFACKMLMKLIIG